MKSTKQTHLNENLSKAKMYIEVKYRSFNNIDEIECKRQRFGKCKFTYCASLKSNSHHL